MTRVLHRLRWILAVAVLLFAAGLLSRQLNGLSWAQLRAAWAATPLLAIGWSLLGTAVSFACLAGFEVIAIARVVPGRVPAGVALRVGAVSHAISNTLGFHVLTGGALRFRAYRGLGLGVADVARVVAVIGACVAAGVVAVAGLAWLWTQLGAGGWASLAMPAAALGVLVLAWRQQRARRHAGSSLLAIIGRDAGPIPVLGALEMVAAIGALYVLLPAGVAPPLAPFVLIFVGAMLLGIASHAPGGIGVFEATVLAALPAGHHGQVLVALLLYRLLYNLLPFALAMTALLLGSMRSAPLPRSVGGGV